MKRVLLDLPAARTHGTDMEMSPLCRDDTVYLEACPYKWASIRHTLPAHDPPLSQPTQSMTNGRGDGKALTFNQFVAKDLG